MSIQGRFKVIDSDDARFTPGSVYDVRLYADRSYDLDNEQSRSNVLPIDEAVKHTSDAPSEPAPFTEPVLEF